MAAEPLDLFVKRTADGMTWPPVRVTADPLDAEVLLDHLEQNARRLDRKPSGTSWLPGYSMRVVPISHRWDAFEVQGRDRIR